MSFLSFLLKPETQSNISHTLNYILIIDLYFEERKHNPLLPFLNIFPENSLFENVSGSDKNSRMNRPARWRKTQRQWGVLKDGSEI